MTPKIRVLLAEDQTMLRGALAALLELEPDISIVAQAANGRRQCAEDTHDIFSKFDPGGPPVCKPMAAIEGECRKRCAKPLKPVLSMC